MNRNDIIYGENDPILELREFEDNIWERDHLLRIYKLDKGWAYDEEIPSGYSEYTYDPDYDFKYVEGDWKQFWTMGLTESLRDWISRNTSLNVDREPQQM